MLERRIGYQESFQQAGLRGIGAAELERGRGAVRFGIAGVERQFRKDLIGQPDHGIETAERVIAVDVGTGAQQIAHRDLGEIVTRARGQRQPRGDVERFISIDAVIRILCIETDRAESEIRGGVDDLSGARHGGIWSDE